IPYAAPEHAVAAIEKLAAPIRVAAFRPLNVALISTFTGAMKPTLLTKTASAVRARIEALGGLLADERRVPHDAREIAQALTSSEKIGTADVFLVAGASAIADRRDVVPAGIEAAGGTIQHFGMPVDPGNLLLAGELHGKSVIGLPGCARSPKLN